MARVEVTRRTFREAFAALVESLFPDAFAFRVPSAPSTLALYADGSSVQVFMLLPLHDAIQIEGSQGLLHGFALLFRAVLALHGQLLANAAEKAEAPW